MDTSITPLTAVHHVDEHAALGSVVTIAESAAHLEVSVQTHYDLRCQGRRPRGFRVGRELRSGSPRLRRGSTALRSPTLADTPSAKALTRTLHEANFKPIEGASLLGRSLATHLQHYLPTGDEYVRGAKNGVRALFADAV